MGQWPKPPRLAGVRVLYLLASLSGGMCFKTGAPNLNNACSKGIPGPQPVHGEIQPHGQTGQFTLQLYEVNTPDRVVRFVPGRQYEGRQRAPVLSRAFTPSPAVEVHELRCLAARCPKRSLTRDPP